MNCFKLHKILNGVVFNKIWKTFMYLFIFFFHINVFYQNELNNGNLMKKRKFI